MNPDAGASVYDWNFIMSLHPEQTKGIHIDQPGPAKTTKNIKVRLYICSIFENTAKIKSRKSPTVK